MTINNPTFTVKSSAARAAKRQGMTNFDIVPVGDRFELRDLDRPLYNSEAREKSTVKGAVRIVWDLCAELIPQGMKRREILARAVDAGVAINTAKTQYQYYRQAAGLSKTAN